MDNKSKPITYADFANSKFGVYIQLAIGVIAIFFFSTLMTISISNSRKVEVIGFSIIIGISAINIVANIIKLARGKTVN